MPKNHSKRYFSTGTDGLSKCGDIHMPECDEKKTSECGESGNAENNNPRAMGTEGYKMPVPQSAKGKHKRKR